MTIEMDVEDYVDLLNERRAQVNRCFGWEIPNSIWDMAMDTIRECGINGDASPMCVVDNLIVNGEWGEYEDYRLNGESRKGLLKRIHNDALAYDDDEEAVLWNF